MSRQICTVDVDYAYSCSSDNDGVIDTVYWSVAQGENGYGWYLSAIVDSDTGSFVDSLVTDDGPYETDQDAMRGGINAALEWHINNDTGDIEWDSRLKAKGYPV